MASGTEHGIFVSPESNEKATINAAADPGSEDGSSTHSHEHVFKDETTAKYWRKVYDEAKYEGRHRFDPNYTWTPEEEKKLVRKVNVHCTPVSCVIMYSRV